MEIKSYIFLTDEGYTSTPNNEGSEPDIHNLQVLGFSDGIDPKDAFDKFLEENTWLESSSFNNIFSLPMDNNYKDLKYFYNIHEK